MNPVDVGLGLLDRVLAAAGTHPKLALAVMSAVGIVIYSGRVRAAGMASLAELASRPQVRRAATYLAAIAGGWVLGSTVGPKLVAAFVGFFSSLPFIGGLV